MLDELCQAGICALLTFVVAALLNRSCLIRDNSKSRNKQRVVRLSLALMLVGLITGVVDTAASGVLAPGVSTALICECIGICLFVGLFEELLFRGILYSLLCKTKGSDAAQIGDTLWNSLLIAALVSIVFAIAHVATALPSVVDAVSMAQCLLKLAQAFFFSLLMCLLFDLTGNVWLPALVHGVFDVALFFPFAARTGEFPQTYISGNIGDCVSLAVGAILLIGCLLMFARKKQNPS